MLTRRLFNATIASAAFVGIPTAEAAADKATFTLYAMKTAWHPIAAIGDWPLDHVALETSTGTDWGCFGRTRAEDPAAQPIARGEGDELWAKAIAGPDGHAGIVFGVTGICHHCANRIALPADIDSRNAPGNEIATPIFGKYGLDTKTLIERVKDAARSVNDDYPKRIADELVTSVVERVGGGIEDERAIVRADLARLLTPVLKSDYPLLKNDIEDVYLSLYYKREALFSAFQRKSIDQATFINRMNVGFVSTLEDLKEVVGADRFRLIVPVPPKLAADYVFYQLPPRFR